MVFTKEYWARRREAGTMPTESNAYKGKTEEEKAEIKKKISDSHKKLFEDRGISDNIDLHKGVKKIQRSGGDDSNEIVEKSAAPIVKSKERTDAEIVAQEREEIKRNLAIKYNVPTEADIPQGVEDPAAATEGSGEVVQNYDGVQPLGSWIDYTVSNKLNAASHCSVKERIYCFKDILILLSPYVNCIEKFEPMLDMKHALDQLLKQSGFKFGLGYKRMMFIRSGEHRRFAEDQYLEMLENLAMTAIKEATEKGVISLQATASGYNNIIYDQGGGFRPQPRRAGQ
jgi:hypothetical protein